MTERTPAPERFWAKVDKSGDCWIFTGYVDVRGYGKFNIADDDQTLGAHRYAYLITFGPIPPGLQIDHLCHTLDESCAGGVTCPHRRCVNPGHMELVTSRENTMRSRVALTAINARKTHCPAGHPYDEANTHWYAGYRTCKACRVEKRYPLAI